MAPRIDEARFRAKFSASNFVEGALGTAGDGSITKRILEHTVSSFGFISLSLHFVFVSSVVNALVN